MLSKLAPLVLSLVGVCSQAGAATPSEDLTQLLTADYNADGVSRQGRVAYSDGVEKVGNAYESTPRESWDPRWDPLSVSTAPQSPNCVSKARGRADCYVTFEVLATSEGKTGISPAGIPFRRIKLLTQPKTLHVHYRLVAKGDRWLALDPPEPFVSAVALKAVLAKESSDRSVEVARLPSGSPNDEKKRRWVEYYEVEERKLAPLAEQEAAQLAPSSAR